MTAVQRAFRRRFNIHRNDSVPARDTILRWVNNLRTGGSIMKKTPPGPQRTVRTPENVERVRQAMLQSPGRSARRHSAALRISNRTVRRILSTCDFFLWGYLKDKPRTLDELKEAIRQQITKINRDLLERVEANFLERLQQCVNENGHHMPDLIFRS